MVSRIKMFEVGSLRVNKGNPGLRMGQKEFMAKLFRKPYLQLTFLLAIIFIAGGCAKVSQSPTVTPPLLVQTGITSDAAVDLAKQRVQKDGVMSLDGRETSVIDEPTQWHISFPISAPMWRGGEPHVIIDKASGAIINVYYTQ